MENAGKTELCVCGHTRGSHPQGGPCDDYVWSVTHGNYLFECYCQEYEPDPDSYDESEVTQ